ncbi:hypothetical protein LTR06_009338 [Exophiala xenobiotica]|nr:hypothetical protein LTR06_009338 [Exophiala xenobiotica]
MLHEICISASQNCYTKQTAEPDCRSRSHNAPIEFVDAVSRAVSIAKEQRQLADSDDYPLKDEIKAKLSYIRNDDRAAKGAYCVTTAIAGRQTGVVRRIPLMDALHKTAAHTIKAPHSTPKADTSAMDGFAVCSSSTANASPKHPVRLRVVSTIAAGDKVDAEQELDGAKDGQINSQATDICVEIMTGARFPRRIYPQLDAVVKVEDVARQEPDPWKRQGEAYICILAHVRKNQNKRDAASDIVKGDPMIHAGQKIEPKHIMALASLGFNEVNVAEDETAPSQLDLRVLGLSAEWKIGVVSTGSELIDLNSLPTNGHSVDKYRAAEETLPNSNGPYICTALRKLDPRQRVLYLGVVKDTEAALEESFRDAILRQGVDVLITTGGVSMGKFDLVKPVVENRMGGKVIFHGVKVRPGLPVMFAWVELDEPNGARPRRRRTAVFGLPGNPLATAMALRFFVVPYLTVLRGELPLIRPIICTARFEQRGDAMHTISSGLERSSGMPRSRRKPEHLRVFWLARWCNVVDGHNGRPEVEILEEQSSYKVGNLIQADCWVEVPEGVHSVSEGEKVMAHPLSPIKHS